MITPKRKGRNIHIILETGIMAVIRAQSSNQLVDVASALRDGGVKAIEVTMTTPNALEVITQSSFIKSDTLLITSSALGVVMVTSMALTPPSRNALATSTN